MSPYQQGSFFPSQLVYDILNKVSIYLSNYLSKKFFVVVNLNTRSISNKWSHGNTSIQTKRMSDFNSGPSLLREKTCQSRRQGELYSFFRFLPYLPKFCFSTCYFMTVREIIYRFHQFQISIRHQLACVVYLGSIDACLTKRRHNYSWD